MKKWIWMIAFLSIAMLPGEGLTSYLIKMKNGVDFVTDMYWEEGNKINFYNYGGTIGISKEQISSITDSEAPTPKEIIQTVPAGDNTGSKKIGNANASDADRNTKNPKFKKKVQQLKSTYQRIKDERVTQTTYFNTAKEQKDQTAKDEAWKTLKKLNSEQNQLSREVQGLYGGNFPEWWD